MSYRSEGLEARLLEALEGHRWAALEVLEPDGTRRTRMLTRERIAAFAEWVKNYAAWRVIAPDDPHLPRFEWITKSPAPGDTIIIEDGQEVWVL
jgi:hypothetical protein